MGVNNPYDGIYVGQEEIVKKLDDISSKLDKFLPKPTFRKETSKKGVFEIYLKSRMLWWSEVPAASRHLVEIEVDSGDKYCKIATFEVERSRHYLSLQDIPADLTCRATVKAEDRDGELIDEGKITL